MFENWFSARDLPESKFPEDILRIWWLTKRLKVVNCIFPISYRKYSIHFLSHRAQKFYFLSPAKQNYLDATFYKNLIWMRNRRIITIFNNVHNFYCKPPFYLECFIFTGWTTPFTSVSRKLWYRRVGANTLRFFLAQNFGPLRVSGNIEFRNQLWTFIWYIWDFIW